MCASDPELLTPGLARLVEGLADRALTGLVGDHRCCASVPRTRTCLLSEGDPAHDDFDVTVVSPHYAAALVSRPCLDQPDLYDAVLTFDRVLVNAAASALARRLHTL